MRACRKPEDKAELAGRQARPSSPAEIRRYERAGQMPLPGLPEPQIKTGAAVLFHQIEDCFVVLPVKGVFRQAPVFRRGAHLYARAGSGFLRLLNRGATTGPSTTWEDLTESPEIAVRNDGSPFCKSEAPAVAIVSRGALAA